MNTNLLNEMLQNKGFIFSYNGIDLFIVKLNGNEVAIKDDVSKYEVIYNYGHNVSYSENEVIEMLKILGG